MPSRVRLGKILLVTYGVCTHTRYVSAEDAGAGFATKCVGDEPGQLERLRTMPAAEIYQHYSDEKAAEANWQGASASLAPLLMLYRDVLGTERFNSGRFFARVHCMHEGFWPNVDGDVIPMQVRVPASHMLHTSNQCVWCVRNKNSRN